MPGGKTGLQFFILDDYFEHEFDFELLNQSSVLETDFNLVKTIQCI